MNVVYRVSILCVNSRCLCIPLARTGFSLPCIPSPAWIIYMLHMDWKRLRKLRITVKHSL